MSTTKNTTKMEKTKKSVLKYGDLISMSQSELQLEELELKVQEAKSTLEVTIATTNRDLAKTKQRLTACQRAVPYSIQDEIDAFEEVKSLETALDYAKKVLRERF
jgi:GTP-dependent phosphoenolpyruvate carboxykinase